MAYDGRMKELKSALRDVLAENDIKAKLLELGIEAKALSGAQLAKRLDDDIVKWGDVITKANTVTKNSLISEKRGITFPFRY